MKSFVFDVGAHHGTYTAMIVELFNDYEGHLFEPTPESFEKLSSGYQDNEKLTLINSAVSNYVGESSFIKYPDDPTRNGLVGVGKEVNFSSEDITCKVMTGDGYCQENGIDAFHLLKIDAEAAVTSMSLKGSQVSLKKQAIDVIQWEYV